MSKVIFTFILGFVLMSFTPNTTTWSVDSAHTKVGFTVTHMLVSDVGGYFKNVTASVTCTKDDFTDATAEFTAQTNSIFTDDKQRDGHLKSPDFFDAEK
jgi:polyisoprenoid-binding protein YceI